MVGIRALLILLTISAVPIAGALPLDVHGAEVCDATGGANACWLAMSAGATASLSYTQETLGCEGSSCTYRPTARLALDTMVPGEWVLRATTYATHYPSNNYLSGSSRELECRVTSADVPCADAELSRDVVGNPFNSARWHGEWRLYLVDATGAEHLQARWSGTGWLAQYCDCPA